MRSQVIIIMIILMIIIIIRVIIIIVIMSGMIRIENCLIFCRFSGGIHKDNKVPGLDSKKSDLNYASIYLSYPPSKKFGSKLR